MSNIILFFNTPLIIVGVAIAITTILGAVVFLENRKSATNIAFMLFSLSAIAWNICNYLFYQPNNSAAFSLMLIRFVVFFAIWYCFFLFILFYVFSNEKVTFPKIFHWIFFPLVGIVSVITLTPLVFKSITSFDITGRVATIENGFGIFIFGATIIFLITYSFFILLLKLIKSWKDRIEREKFTYIFIGAVLTFTLHIIFNMILPAFFNISQFTALGAVFTLPFSIFTSIAIIKYQLFNVKIISTEVITFVLWLFLLMRTLTASIVQEQIIDGVLLVVTIIIGVLLIRSVIKEVKQREKLEVLSGQLKEANINLEDLLKQRESLVHLVTHKVKGSFTRSKYIFAGMLEGMFGEINDEVKKRAQQGLDSDNMGIETVDLVLNAANLEKGTVKYEMKTVDLKELLKNTISEKRISAESKGLKIEEEIKDDVYNVSGDPFWLKEVLNNLVENSIKYTKEGKITVGLLKQKEKILFSVKDTGIGITDEDRKNLFTEGGRGKDSVKTNVDSTGYGLYSVKMIVDAHKGRVWMESDGPQKGSQFYVELDAI